MAETEALMSIGRVAQDVGMATHTLRYYEREGLLKPAGRSRAGYRLYESSAVEQLRFIRSAQGVGFSLQDIRALLALDERTSCKKVQGMITDRLGEVDRRIGELKRVQVTLKQALNRCRKSRRGCPVLSDFRKQKPRGSRGSR